jgi:hypothetical protein
VKIFASLYLKALAIAALRLIPAGIGCVLYLVVRSFVVDPTGETDLVVAGVISMLVVSYAVFIGFFLVALVGAPAYALLVQFRQDKWPYVFLLGVIPGLIFLYFDRNVGPFVIGCGVFVAMSTHHSFLRQARHSEARAVA